MSTPPFFAPGSPARRLAPGSPSLRHTPDSPSLRDAFAATLLVADGAMGTQLYERGFGYEVSYEGLNLTQPEVIRNIHESYIGAGANLLEANTFGANRVRLERHGLADRVDAINRAALRLAREAAGDAAFVVGAIGPSGLSLANASEAERRRAEYAFREQAAALAAAGADGLVVETMIGPDELALAVSAARLEAPNLPLIAQVSVDERLALSDGTPVALVGARLRDLGADAVGINCGEGPAQALLAVERLLSLGLPLTAMPNAGLPYPREGPLDYPSSPEHFGALARRLFALGVALVGGCCGTTPEHVRALAAAADEARERTPD